MVDLNTSMAERSFLPEERAVLPAAGDLQSEYLSLMGKNVNVDTQAHSGRNTVPVYGQLSGVLKGPNGDLVLKITMGSETHYIAQSKIIDLRVTAY